MPFIDRPGCRLFYSVVDVTPPWVEADETIIFHHGVSATGGGAGVPVPPAGNVENSRSKIFWGLFSPVTACPAAENSI